MAEFYLAVGDQVRFSKTVSESDVYLFAGITGDLAPNHVDEEYMRGTPYGRRIAHGALLIGFMSTASTMMVERHGGLMDEETPVSLGYDRGNESAGSDRRGGRAHPEMGAEEWC